MNDLTAYAVADTMADPIPLSVCRVAKKAAARVGYSVTGICLHCIDAVVPGPVGQTWIHHSTGIVSCVASRAREWDVETGRPVGM